MDFVTIDFETATRHRHSPCEVGITIVQGGQIKDTKSWLIKPPQYPDFEYMNVSIHGITPNHVADAPEFPDVWREVEPFLNGHYLVAHNTDFDMGVLQNTLQVYGMPTYDSKYVCSYRLAKNVWHGLPNYDLKSMCKHHGIELRHHRAASDSLATAHLMIKAAHELGISNLSEIKPSLQWNVNFVQFEKAQSSREKVVIEGDPTKHDPYNMFYGKTVVFTGAMSCMQRLEAQQYIADIGGIVGGGVTQKTDYLVVGWQDYRVVGEDGMSNKQEKAVKMIAAGAKLEILSEEQFLQNIEWHG